MPPYAAAQRVILPELVGEDETRMSQANSSIEGGIAAAALIGPALAGMLIPFLGAPNVLYIDAATYLVAFVLVLLFVPRPKPLDRGAERGVLEGLRFVASDSFIGALAARSWSSASSPPGCPLGSPRTRTSTSTGAPGSRASSTARSARARRRDDHRRHGRTKDPPLRLAAVGILGVSLPLWLLRLPADVASCSVALFLAPLFTPLVNGPIIGVAHVSMTPEIRDRRR